MNKNFWREINCLTSEKEFRGELWSTMKSVRAVGSASIEFGSWLATWDPHTLVWLTYLLPAFVFHLYKTLKRGEAEEVKWLMERAGNCCKYGDWTFPTSATTPLILVPAFAFFDCDSLERVLISFILPSPSPAYSSYLLLWVRKEFLFLLWGRSRRSPKEDMWSQGSEAAWLPHPTALVWLGEQGNLPSGASK